MATAARKRWKYRSGFCQTGECEGTRPRSFSGKPMKTCPFWEMCPCDCHRVITEMFALSGLPRILVENPEYVPERSPYVLPPRFGRVDIALSNSGDPNAPKIVESPAPDVVPATIARTFGPTPSGRAARGELEAWTKRSCDDWLVDQPGIPCTPKLIAEEVAKREGLGKEPSTGAITSIFDRWQKIGFAIIERKPVRFIRYTPEGIEHGLEYMKAKAKEKQ